MYGFLMMGESEKGRESNINIESGETGKMKSNSHLLSGRQTGEQKGRVGN